MVTRDTHARIYQHELSKQEYDRLHQLASSQQVNVNELLASSVKACLKKWGIQNSIEIEEITVDDGKVRFYLWIPYTCRDLLERVLRKKHKHIQDVIPWTIRKRIEKLQTVTK